MAVYLVLYLVFLYFSAIAASSNQAFNQTGVVTACFLRLQCAAGYLNR